MGLFDFTFKVKREESVTAPIGSGESILDTIQLKVIDYPKPFESKAHDWVLNGVNNNFPIRLLEYLNSSSMHSAIIESKSNLISGNGILFQSTREASNQWIIDNFKMVPFWRKLDQVFYSVTKDQQIFGYSCYEVIYSMDHTRIVDINWLDASRVATGRKNSNGEIEFYWYCEDWSQTTKFPPRKIMAFNTNNKDVRQLMFIKREENNMDYYALPTYYSALKWIKADALMADYNVSAIQNGFSPSIVFKFYKKPSPEERRMNAEQIRSQHGGTRNAGKALIFYADGKDLAPDVDTLDATNIDKRLIEVSEQITQQIISAHRINPTLCGISVPGKLGYSNEVAQNWAIFNAQVIRPERKLILDSFKEVLIYNGVTFFQIEELDLVIKNNQGA